MKTPTWLRRILDTLTGKTATPARGANVPTQKTTPPMRKKTPTPDPYVYITKTGKKFHYDRDCPALANAWSRNEVIKIELSKARASGRSACGKCCYDYLRE